MKHMNTLTVSPTIVIMLSTLLVITLNARHVKLHAKLTSTILNIGSESIFCGCTPVHAVIIILRIGNIFYGILKTIEITIIYYPMLI